MTSLPPATPIYTDEPAWWKTVAWPQVLTLAGLIALVIVPVLLALALAA